MFGMFKICFFASIFQYLLSLSTIVSISSQLGGREYTEYRSQLLRLPVSCFAMAVVSTSRLSLAKGSIPVVGYGCWKLDRANAAELVEKAIRMGYRHIDGACDYGNEKEVIDNQGETFSPGRAWNQTSHRSGRLQKRGALCHLQALEYFSRPGARGGSLQEEP